MQDLSEFLLATRHFRKSDELTHMQSHSYAKVPGGGVPLVYPERLARRGTRHCLVSLALGPILDLFRQLFDLLGFLHYGKRESGSGVGLLDLFFELGDQLIKLLNLRPDFGLVLLLDDLGIESNGRLGVTDPMREIRVGRVWRRDRLWSAVG